MPGIVSFGCDAGFLHSLWKERRVISSSEA